MSKISLILLNYNKKPYAKETFVSIVNQSFCDVELILPTNFKESILKDTGIISSIKKRGINLLFYNSKDNDYSFSINEAITKVSSEYVAFFNDGDYFEPGSFFKMNKVLNSHHPDVLKFDIFYHYLDNGKWLCDSKHVYPQIKPNNIFSIKQFPNFINYYSFIFGSLFKTSKIVKLMPSSIIELSNYLFYVETLLCAQSIVYQNKKYYHHFDTFVQNKSKYSDKNSVDSLCNIARLLTDLTNKHCYLTESALSGIFNFVNYVASVVQDNVGYSSYFASEYKKVAQNFKFNLYSSAAGVSQKMSQISFISPLNNIFYSCPKILIYNWLPYDNPWNWGGGVNIYCKNLIESLIRYYPFCQIYFLSSGFAYQAITTSTFVRQIPSLFGDMCKQFEIVNSPIPAMQRNIYTNPCVALKNDKLKKVFADFIDKYGPFSAIHFNNLEGLSLDVFDLKQNYPLTKFIFSMHNYIPICVTGGYYMRHKKCVCNKNHTKFDCFKCTRADIIQHVSSVTYKRGLYGIDSKDAIPEKQWINALHLQDLDKNVSVNDILKFADVAKNKLNKNCDSILAVSKRVYDIVAAEGIDKNKLIVSYIGTKVADYQTKCSNAPIGKKMNVIFLGSDLFYEEKGYPFLLAALKKMDNKHASQINLTLTLLQGNQNEKIKHLLHKFNSVKIINGYKPDDLKFILKGQHLSIIPVVWEDNLPQIAIESVANGVPILSSSFGGASELSSSDRFKFIGGDTDDFLKKLTYFADNPNSLNEFWAHHNGLTTLKQHCSELISYYGLTKKYDSIKFSAFDVMLLFQERNFFKNHFEMSFQNYSEIQKRADNWTRLNNIVCKLLPYGSRRRKFVKRLYFKKRGVGN